MAYSAKNITYITMLFYLQQLMRELEVDFCVLNHNNTKIIDYRTSHQL